jgi:gliding motility-associated lipoprotein GldJ
LSGLREYNLYRGKKKYPWDGEYTRSKNKRTQGDQLANFKQGKGDYSGIQGWSSDGADITAPVMSYPPNDFGLYDMSGNVTEWVADVYRPIIDDEANDFNYYRGNIFQKTQINEDGKTVVIDSDEFLNQLEALNNDPTLEKANDSVTYAERLPNGKINILNFPGEIVTENVDKEDTYLRTNYGKADNRDFRDGDSGSKRLGRNNDEDVMYNAPSFRPGEKDQSNDKTSLISNKVRVIKGGSWRDRAFWLDPAQRRFLPEFMATDYIGFRCAMSYLGQKPQKKKPRG